MAEVVKRRLTQILSAFSPANNVPPLVAALQATFPASQLSFDETTLARFGSSMGSVSAIPSPPTVVVHAETTEDVVKAVRIARETQSVIIPVAGRTSLEGSFQPPSCCDFGEEAARGQGSSKGAVPTSSARPTIHLSVARMDKILAVHPADFQAVVEPGIGWSGLNEHLAEQGIPLFFPVDPAPGAFFGGMVGVAGSGTNAVKYGTMKGEWVLGMEVVLMDGRIINTRGNSRARKSSTGWDVGRLFIGSEGTLGIVTKVTVRLAPVAPLKAAYASFPTVSHAVNAVVSIIAAGLDPTSLELLDGTSIRGLNLAEILPKALPELPTIFFRFSHFLPAAIDAALEEVARIVERNNGSSLHIGQDDAENERIWRARKNQFWSQQLLIGEGCQTLITDVCVPISRLAEFVEKSEKDVQDSGLLAPIVAHVGDGNVHRAILYKPKPGETSTPPEVVALASRLSLLAIELEGTCAGEHGVGVTKRKYLEQELGANTLEVMRKVKKLLDPDGLLNPVHIWYSDFKSNHIAVYPPS